MTDPYNTSICISKCRAFSISHLDLMPGLHPWISSYLLFISLITRLAFPITLQCFQQCSRRCTELQGYQQKCLRTKCPLTLMALVFTLYFQTWKTEYTTNNPSAFYYSICVADALSPEDVASIFPGVFPALFCLHPLSYLTPL